MDIFEYPNYFNISKIYDWLKLEDSSVNIQNNNKQTLLHLNAIKGHALICEFLISNGANIHLKDSFEETCYHDADRNGHEPVKELLLRAGADHSLKSSYYL